MARCKRAATTLLSTPPDSAQRTCPWGPTRAWTWAMASSTKLPIVQSARAAHAPNRKFSITRSPRSLCATSGWNWSPKDRSSGDMKAATGQLSVRASTAHPGGGASTWSP